MLQMKASDIKRALYFAMKAGRPVMIWGVPGMGKSTIGRQFAQEQNRSLFEMTTTAIEPIDVRGAGKINEQKKKVVWYPPDFLPDKENSVFQMEDLTNGHPQVLTSLYSLILDGRIGNYQLPKNTFIIANGNMEHHKSYVAKMPMALAARLLHVEMVFDLEDFINNGIDQDFAIEVLSFARAFPKHINAFNPESDEKAQPTPRTWEFVSDIVKAEPDKDLILPLTAGCVGKGAALEFSGFLEIFSELPDVSAVLKNPLSLKEIPTKSSVMFAFIGAMSRRVEEKTMDNFIVVAERMVTEKLSEYAVTMVNDAVRYKEELKKTTGYVLWSTKYQKLYK